MNIGPIKIIERHTIYKENSVVTVRIDVETESGETYTMRLTAVQWVNLIQNTTKIRPHKK